jgi:two-component sensor histidine kinase
MRVWGLPRELSGRLAFRLAVLLSMALLPLGAIAIHAATELQRAAERAAERSLISLAADAVAGERALIESALASTRALESFVLESRDDPEACSDLLRRHVDQAGVYSFAGFIGADGLMACRSQGEAVDFAGTSGFEGLRAAPATAITANSAGLVTGLPVIIVSRPVFAQGGLAGFLSISISQRTLEIMAQRRIDDGPAAVVLLNQPQRRIARDEAERERALAEKTVLLKEVHHRVKNNLQLIASVINMQLRQVTDRAGRDVLQSIQQRVLGLASVHRELYDEDRLSRARVDRVVEALLRRVAALGAGQGRGPELRLRLQPLVLDADRLVPLSFLLHEAVNNALKHLAGAPPGAAWIEVDLTGTAPGDLVLRLRNPILRPAQRDGAARTTLRDSGGLGSELIEAFAAQLDGTCTQGTTDDPEAGTVWELELRFPIPAEAAEPAGP